MREWFGGVYWWKWSTDPSPWSDDGAAGNDKAPGNNSDFFPQHKPAQQVLTHYYSHGCPTPPVTIKLDDEETTAKQAAARGVDQIRVQSVLFKGVV